MNPWSIFLFSMEKVKCFTNSSNCKYFSVVFWLRCAFFILVQQYTNRLRHAQTPFGQHANHMAVALLFVVSHHLLVIIVVLFRTTPLVVLRVPKFSSHKPTHTLAQHKNVCGIGLHIWCSEWVAFSHRVKFDNQRAWIFFVQHKISQSG